MSDDEIIIDGNKMLFHANTIAQMGEMMQEFLEMKGLFQECVQWIAEYNPLLLRDVAISFRTLSELGEKSDR